MTLVICPNLALDRMLIADHVRPGGTTRCRALRTQAGGKGANVAASHQGPRRRGAAHRLRRRPRRPADRRARAGRGAGARGRRDGRARRASRPSSSGTTGPSRACTSSGREVGCRRRAGAAGPCPRPGRPRPASGPSSPGRRHRASRPASTPPSSAPPVTRAIGPWSTRPASNSAGALAERPDLVKVNLAEACSAVGVPEMHCDDEKSATAAQLVAEGLELCRRLVEAGAAGAVLTLGAAGAVAVLDGAECARPRGR